jgi:hypothetical protein
MAYRVHPRALARWSQENLTLLEEEGPRMAFRFRYRGSICINGGGDFLVHLDLTLQRAGNRFRVAEAAITLDPEGTGTPTSCHLETSQQNLLVAQNVASSGVVGADLEAFLETDRPLNPGGCFCSLEHVNHKLLLALHTIRYYLQSQGNPSGPEKKPTQMATTLE